VSGTPSQIGGTQVVQVNAATVILQANTAASNNWYAGGNR